MKYRVKNSITNEFEYFDSPELADIALAKNKTDYLEQEKSRFTVCKVTTNGNDTVWSAADLANDSEDAEYQVFNQYTGQHEVVSSLTLAKGKKQEVISRFVTESGLDSHVAVDKIPDKKVGQPITTIPEF